MAKKRSARKAAQPRSRRGRKNARKAARPKATPARRAAAKKGAKKAAKKAGAKRAARPRSRQVAKRAPVRAAKKAAAKRRVARRAAAPKRTPNLERQRRTVAETERIRPMPPSSLNMDRTASAARTGRAELADKLREHTSTGPALTGGDVDADWESAEAVGDEAPGGDNPTPDQDVVDNIGRAVGIEYDDDEELQGGDEIVKRDKKRWELDPASSDDFDDRE
jgi:hypothetical protein